MTRHATRLIVLSGCHAGSARVLGDEPVDIGSALADDVVLFADPLEAGHLTLRRDTRGKHEVTANAPGTTVDGVPVEASESRPVRLPAAIEVNGVALRWEVVPLARPARVVRAVALAGLACIALAVGLRFSPELGAFHGSEPSPVAAADVTTAPSAATEPPHVLTRPRGADVEGALARLASLVEESGIEGIALEAGATTITATGAVTPAVQGRWQKVQQAFDAAQGGGVSLVSLVRVEASEPASVPPISAVWRGESPYVVVRGAKHAVGATLGGEWEIVAIGAEAVTLRRKASGDTVTIGF